VQVHGKAVSVTLNPPQYDIMIQIRSVGEQYRLGDLNIVKAVSFPRQQLRDLFPIQRGEIFSRERIAKGLEELRRIYGSQGYINFTSVPVTQFDDANGSVDLNIDVDEGKQFRVRSFEILGLDSDAEARVLDDIELKPGDIFSSEAWERSFTKFRDLAQNPDPNAVDKRLDERDGWVDVVLDFRKPLTCPISLSAESAILLRGLPSAEQH
jgi:outer membrane protein insertion porin family